VQLFIMFCYFCVVILLVVECLHVLNADAELQLIVE